MKLLNNLNRFLLSNMASVVLCMAVFAAGARSAVGGHEPKVPAKLRKS